MEKIVLTGEELIKIETQIAENKSNIKATNKRVDELSAVTVAFYELAGDVKKMVSELSNIKTDMSTMKEEFKKDISDVKNDINKFHREEPNKLITTVKTTIVTVIVTAIIGAIVGLVIVSK